MAKKNKRQNTMTGYDAPLKKGRWVKRETPAQWNRNGWGDVGGVGTATAVNRRSGDLKAANRRRNRDARAAAAEERMREQVRLFGEASRHDPPMVVKAPEPKIRCAWCDREFQPMGTTSPLCWECRRVRERTMLIEGGMAPLGEVLVTKTKIIRASGFAKSGKSTRNKTSPQVTRVNASVTLNQANAKKIAAGLSKFDICPDCRRAHIPTEQNVAAESAPSSEKRVRVKKKSAPARVGHGVVVGLTRDEAKKVGLPV